MSEAFELAVKKDCVSQYNFLKIFLCLSDEEIIKELGL